MTVTVDWQFNNPDSIPDMDKNLTFQDGPIITAKKTRTITQPESDQMKLLDRK